jgi:hypothetical protein
MSSRLGKRIRLRSQTVLQFEVTDVKVGRNAYSRATSV